MQRRRRAWAAAATVIVAHGALFAALSLPGPARIDAVSVSLVSLGPGMSLAPARPDASDPIAAIVPPPPEPKPPEPTPVAEPAAPEPFDVAALTARLIATAPSSLSPPPLELASSVPAPTVPPQPPEAGGADDGQACDITEAVRGALQQDLAVQAALARVPDQARSVANAIMLWDGRWADAAALGGVAGADPIRGAIVEQVRFEPPACRDRPVLGPRFIPLAGAVSTTVLAVGSGEWRWSDLLAEGSGR